MATGVFHIELEDDPEVSRTRTSELMGHFELELDDVSLFIDFRIFWY